MTIWNRNFIQVCLSNFLMACSFNLLMPTIPLYITEQLHVPQYRTGIVLASYAMALMLTRPFSGYMVDVFSRKKILVVSFFLYVLTFGAYFFATTVTLFVIIRFIHGLWWGGGTVASSTLAIDVLPANRRSEGVGYYGTFNNVAMAVGPFIAIYIYQEFGFDLLIWCAIAMGSMGVISATFIKGPKKQGIKPSVPSWDRFFLVKAWPIFINQLMLSFCWGTIGAYVAQYGKEINIPNAGVFFLFWATGIIVSRVFSGKFVDRGHIHIVNVIAMGVVALSFLAFALFHTLVAFCISGFFIGMGFGMMLPALQMLYINIAPADRRGTANSTYLLAFDIGIAIGMLAGGYISAAYGFSFLYQVCAGIFVLSMVVYLLVSRPVYNKNRLPVV